MKHSDKPLYEVLEGTHWLQGLPISAKERVFEDAYEAFFDRGEVVVRKGDTANAWLGVAEGLLKISTVHRSGKTVMFSPLLAGSWAGEGSVFKGKLFLYDIVAMRPTRVVLLPGPTFLWLLNTCVEFDHILIARLNERLGTFIAMMEIDRLTDPVAKVAQALAITCNSVLHPCIGPRIPLSQTELGELIGMSRQGVSVALKKLESEGLLTTDYGAVVVRDLTAMINYQERD